MMPQKNHAQAVAALNYAAGVVEGLPAPHRGTSQPPDA
jgi:hypothetical protein